jgi:peptidylprolyl isomerase
MRWTRISALGLTAAMALATTACGSSTKPTSNPTGGQPGNATTTSTTGAPTKIAAISMPSPAGTWGVKPAVTVPVGRPPTVLESSDLIVGTGPAAKAGDTVTVQYVGVNYATETQFQASWDANMPFSFTLGEGQVIKGWDEGVVGMKVGGRRELILPPDLAYGSSPPPNSGISANATLIFVIDLLKIG